MGVVGKLPTTPINIYVAVVLRTTATYMIYFSAGESYDSPAARLATRQTRFLLPMVLASTIGRRQHVAANDCWLPHDDLF